MKSSRRLDFSPDAEDDLRSILEYTLTIWGERQHDAYAEHISAALDELIRFPDLGHLREDISSGLRSRAVERHVVYYRVNDQYIKVLRIVHSKMDVPTRLEQ